MTPRDRLATLLAPDVLDALEALVAEKVAERLRVVGAERMAERHRSGFLSVQEAADLLRCDRQRVYDLLSSGRLTRLKDGSRVLIRRAEIEAWLANGRREA